MRKQRLGTDEFRKTLISDAFHGRLRGTERQKITLEPKIEAIFQNRVETTV